MSQSCLAFLSLQMKNKNLNSCSPQFFPLPLIHSLQWDMCYFLLTIVLISHYFSLLVHSPPPFAYYAPV